MINISIFPYPFYISQLCQSSRIQLQEAFKFVLKP